MTPGLYTPNNSSKPTGGVGGSGKSAGDAIPRWQQLPRHVRLSPDMSLLTPRGFGVPRE